MLIVNPTSGSEKAKNYASPMRMKLSEMFDQVEVKETKKAFDATAFAKDAANAGVNAVFCMGGDGTVNETINGLAQGKHHPHFGFIPMGTVNDLARSLQIPLKPEDAIRSLTAARLAPIDIGRVNDVYFANGLAIGTLSEAVADVSIEEKTKLGSLAYFLKGIRALKEQKIYRFNIETDTTVFCVESSLIAVTLSSSMGSFEKFMQFAEAADGKLRLLIFTKFEIIGIMKILSKMLSGDIGQSEFVNAMEIKWAKISVIGDAQLFTNVAGDRGPDLPLDIEVLPSFLQVYLPGKKR